MITFLTEFFIFYFSAAGIESRVVQRFDYDEHAVEWADAVVTAGGLLGLFDRSLCVL